MCMVYEKNIKGVSLSEEDRGMRNIMERRKDTSGEKKRQSRRKVCYVVLGLMYIVTSELQCGNQPAKDNTLHKNVILSTLRRKIVAKKNHSES